MNISAYIDTGLEYASMGEGVRVFRAVVKNGVSFSYIGEWFYNEHDAEIDLKNNT